MNIQHNMQAMNAQRNMGIASTRNSKAQEKLSSGYRINRAGDDAAGLAISEKMRGQIKGLSQASRNAQDGISLIQTAEGALGTTHEILQRMRQLAVQSSNDTNTDDDRAELQKEVDELANEINRISTDTEFNTMKLLNGDFSGKKFHVGANQSQNISLTIKDMSAEGLAVYVKNAAVDAVTATLNGTLVPITGYSGGTIGTIDSTEVTGVGDLGSAITVTMYFYTGFTAGDKFDAYSVEYGATVVGVLPGKTSYGVKIDTQASANSAIETINAAIILVSAERAKLGANQNRLEYTTSNLDLAAENLQSSESRIRDVDMAAEVLNQTQTSVLQQAAQSMLAMANQQPQSVLSLLQ